MQTETRTDSKEGTSSSLGDVTGVDEQNEGLLKIIKVEESGDEGYLGKTTDHWRCTVRINRYSLN